MVATTSDGPLFPQISFFTHFCFFSPFVELDVETQGKSDDSAKRENGPGAGFPERSAMTVGKRTLLITLTAFFIAIALWLAILPPRTSRIFLNQLRAVASIRNLNLAEHDYAARHPDNGFACNLADLRDRGSEDSSHVALADRVLASGTRSSYHFDIRCASEIGRAAAYTATATPTKPGITGQYAFCADESKEIWYSESGSPSDCLANHKPVEQIYK
jgi:hypothetical protein